MWIVRNTLKATLSLRGLDVSIPAGEQFDLDTLGRDEAEESNQIRVAFEEGYLENVHKASRTPAPAPAASGGGGGGLGGIYPQHFDSRLESFKQEFLSELRTHLPVNQDGPALEQIRASITQDVQELVGELKQIRERFATVKDRIQEDPNLSDAEVRARLAFLDEQERELLKNFETVGRQIEQEDGDVMDKADLLANL